MELKKGDTVKVKNSNIDKPYFCKIYSTSKTRATGAYNIQDKDGSTIVGKIVFKRSYKNYRHIRPLYSSTWGITHAELVINEI